MGNLNARAGQPGTAPGVCCCLSPLTWSCAPAGQHRLPGLRGDATPAQPLPVPQVMLGPAWCMPRLPHLCLWHTNGPCWVLGLSGKPDVEKGIWARAELSSAASPWGLPRGHTCTEALKPGGTVGGDVTKSCCETLTEGICSCPPSYYFPSKAM